MAKVNNITIFRGQFKDLLFTLDPVEDITGWEILGTLRARPETKDTPIVILTGHVSSKEKEKILQKARSGLTRRI